MAETALHECAAEGCERLVGLHLLMCIEHWRRVPAPLQRAVLATWRRVRVVTPKTLANMKDYRAAVQAAVDAVGEKDLNKARVRAAVGGDLFPATLPGGALPITNEHGNNTHTQPGREPFEDGGGGAECAGGLRRPGAAPGAEAGG